MKRRLRDGANGDLFQILKWITARRCGVQLSSYNDFIFAGLKMPHEDDRILEQI